MVIAAAKNVRLNSRPLRLLLFLEGRSNGFRPAQKWIEKNTGIAKNKISEVRNELVQHGMIGYGDGKILFDWNRMRTYAALSEPLAKIGYHKPIDGKTQLTVGELGKRYKIIGRPRILDTDEKCFFEHLDNMTEVMWLGICRLFPEYNPPSFIIDTDDSNEHLLWIEYEDTSVDDTDDTDYSEWVMPEPLPF